MKAQAGRDLVLAMAAAASMAAWRPATPIAAQEARGRPPAQSGWLIVSGPAGTAHSCAATRAFSLTTGAVFVHDGCADRSAAGRASAASIREAVSALLARAELPWTAGEHRTVQTWRWVVSDERSLIGDLPWPDAERGEDRGAGRLAAIEAGLVEGCAPPLPPPGQVLAAVLPELVHPVSADDSQQLTARYRAARERWARLSACPGRDP